MKTPLILALSCIAIQINLTRSLRFPISIREEIPDGDPINKPVVKIEMGEDYNFAKCDPILLKQILGTPEQKDFITPTDGILDICPSIKESCCSEAEIEKFAKILHVKGQTLDALIETIQVYTKTIVDMGKTRVSKLDNLMNRKGCIRIEGLIIEDGFDYIHQNAPEIVRVSERVIKFLRSRSASVICEVCSTHAVQFLDIKEKRTHLIMHNNYCKRFFTSQIGLDILKFFNYMTFFEPFIAGVACLKENAMKLHPILRQSAYVDALEKYEECKGRYSKAPFVDATHCVTFCREYTPLNDNIFHVIGPLFQTSLIMLNNILKSNDFAKCPVQMSAEKLNKNNKMECVFSNVASADENEQIQQIQFFEYYLPLPDKPVKHPIFNVNWLISSIDGMNPDQNQIKVFEFDHLHILRLLPLLLLLALGKFY